MGSTIDFPTTSQLRHSRARHKSQKGHVLSLIRPMVVINWTSNVRLPVAMIHDRIICMWFYATMPASFRLHSLAKNHSVHSTHGEGNFFSP